MSAPISRKLIEGRSGELFIVEDVCDRQAMTCPCGAECSASWEFCDDCSAAYDAQLWWERRHPVKPSEGEQFVSQVEAWLYKEVQQ